MTRTKSWKCLFQSALPRGERHILAQDLTGSGNFNPRSHEGSDGIDRYTIATWRDISIRAPTRGATFVPFGNLICTRSFQSALPRGERLGYPMSYIFGLDFNPRSHEGSDFSIDLRQVLLGISIRAPTRGATGDRFKMCTA